MKRSPLLETVARVVLVSFGLSVLVVRCACQFILTLNFPPGVLLAIGFCTVLRLITYSRTDFTTRNRCIDHVMIMSRVRVPTRARALKVTAHPPPLVHAHCDVHYLRGWQQIFGKTG